MANFEELRAAYMATAISETDPPELRTFLRDRGVTIDSEIRIVLKRAKTGNWVGHWNKHRMRAMSIIEDTTLAAFDKQVVNFAQKRVELLLEQLEQIDAALPAAIREATDRIDFMDDKALVAFIKAMADSRKDAVKQLESLDPNKPKAGDQNPVLPGNQQVNPMMSGVMAVMVGVLEAHESGKNPQDVIEAAFRKDDVDKRKSAFAALDAMMEDDDNAS